jgi:ferric-dicitrate binding protein FerR (iron transport regulator)
MSTASSLRSRRWALGLAAALLLLPVELPARDVAGVITQIVGALYVKNTGETSFRRAKKGEFVYEGTTLKTGKGDRAAVSLVSGTEIKVSELTVYTIRTTHPSRRGQGNDTTLSSGRMWFKVLRKGSKFQIKTPVAAVSVRGTEGDVQTSGTDFRASCYEGSFHVNPTPQGGDEDADEGLGEGGSVVSAGQQAVIQGGGQLDVRKFEEAGTWQEEVSGGGHGAFKLTAERTEVKRGVAVKVVLTAYDSGGHKDEAAEAEARVYADRDDVELSLDGQSGWSKGGVSVRLRAGEAQVYVRSGGSGPFNVSATSDGYEAGNVRITAARPAEREVEVEVETETGEKKRLKLKFRR